MKIEYYKPAIELSSIRQHRNGTISFADFTGRKRAGYAWFCLTTNGFQEITSDRQRRNGTISFADIELSSISRRCVYTITKSGYMGQSWAYNWFTPTGNPKFRNRFVEDPSTRRPINPKTKQRTSQPEYARWPLLQASGINGSVYLAPGDGTISAYLEELLRRGMKYRKYCLGWQ